MERPIPAPAASTTELESGATPDPHGQHRLARSGIAVTVISVFGMAAATVVQLLVAWSYGAGDDADAFVIATTLPLYLQAVVVGALGVVMMPALSEARVQNGPSASNNLAHHLALRLTLLLGIISILGTVFAEPIIRLTAPGLSPSSVAVAARLSRWLWPSLCALGVSTVFAAVLQLDGRFVWPAMVPAVGSVVNAGLIVSGSRLLGIDAVAIGVLAGSVLQVAVLAFLCWRPKRDPGATDGLARQATMALVASVPLILSGLLVRITPVIDRYFASQFHEGTIARLGYAFRLVAVVPALLTVGLGVVLFPRMSLSVARDQLEELRGTVSTGLRVTLTLCVPTILVGLILTPSLVRVLLERGAFSAEDTAAVAQASRVYLPSLLSFFLCAVTGRAIYALKSVSLLASLGAAEAVLYVGYAFVLVRFLGWQGIPLSFTIYNLLSLGWQLVYLRYRLGAVMGEGVGLLLARTLGGGSAAAAIVWAVTLLPGSPWMHVIFGGVSGAACFVFALHASRSPELRTILGLLRNFASNSSTAPVQGT